MCRSLFCALALLGLPARAVETVRISMGELSGEVSVQAEGLASGADQEDEHAARRTPISEARARIREVGGALEVNGQRVADAALRFRAAPGSTFRVAGWEVAGELVVRRVGSRLQLINVIPLEDYLVGVLGGEMPPQFPSEALKAQAVAARTYAVYKKLAAYGGAYHLGSSVLHQVYQGLRHVDARARAAVEATRGEVLTYQLAPIEAYFHASCGGRTESGKEALQRDLPYLQAVDCPCGDLPQSRWTLALSGEELVVFGCATEGAGSACQRPEPRGDRAAPPDLRVALRSPTGRARSIRLGGQMVDGVTFRQKLGYDRVKSLAFDVQSEGKAFLLRGKGHGHGAGMCQLGARILAERGRSYQEILEHYYPGIEIQALY